MKEIAAYHASAGQQTVETGVSSNAPANVDAVVDTDKPRPSMDSGRPEQVEGRVKSKAAAPAPGL